MKADFYSVIMEEEIDTGCYCSLVPCTLATFPTLSSAKSYARYIKKIYVETHVFVVPQTWGQYTYNNRNHMR